ncbi:MAG: hypothetical protein JRD02_05050 [Deltaproteobacteria bacterium]|nr:hypothetical protein [Deltaproteobacteria bacterium]
MLDDSAVERKLSPSEKLWWIIDQECRSNFVMHAHVTGSISEEVLRPSLDAIQARHPLLRVRIERDGWNSLSFKTSRVAGLPLRIVEKPTDAWTDEAEKELHEEFTVHEGPLARYTLVRHAQEDNTVLIAFHHAIGDAISGSFLMRDLFQAMALAYSGKKCELSPLEPKREMNAYFPEWALGLSGRWRSMKFAGRMFGAVLRYGKPAVPKFDHKAPPKERRARVVAHRLDPDFIDRLHRRANEEGTTLHGALLAAQILAIAHDREDTKECPYFIGSPVNLRKRLNPPVGEDVGFFVTIGASINLAKRDIEFWPLAKAVRESLWNCVERGEPFVYMIQYQYLSKITSLLGLGLVGRLVYARVGTSLTFGGLAFSNIGKVDIENHQGPFTIEALGFAASPSSLSPLAAFAATINRQSTWNFVGMEPLLTKEHTKRIAAKAFEVLSRAV